MIEPPASVNVADGAPAGTSLLLSKGDVLGRALVGMLAFLFILLLVLFL